MTKINFKFATCLSRKIALKISNYQVHFEWLFDDLDVFLVCCRFTQFFPYINNLALVPVIINISLRTQSAIGKHVSLMTETMVMDETGLREFYRETMTGRLMMGIAITT